MKLHLCLPNVFLSRPGSCIEKSSTIFGDTELFSGLIGAAMNSIFGIPPVLSGTGSHPISFQSAKINHGLQTSSISISNTLLWISKLHVQVSIPRS